MISIVAGLLLHSNSFQIGIVEDKNIPAPPVISHRNRSDAPVPSYRVVGNGFCGDYKFKVTYHKVRSVEEFTSVIAEASVSIMYDGIRIPSFQITVPNDSSILSIVPYCDDFSSLSLRVLYIDEKNRMIGRYINYKDGEVYRDYEVDDMNIFLTDVR